MQEIQKLDITENNVYFIRRQYQGGLCTTVLESKRHKNYTDRFFNKYEVWLQDCKLVASYDGYLIFPYV